MFAAARFPSAGEGVFGLKPVYAWGGNKFSTVSAHDHEAGSMHVWVIVMKGCARGKPETGNMRGSLAL